MPAPRFCPSPLNRVDGITLVDSITTDIVVISKSSILSQNFYHPPLASSDWFRTHNPLRVVLRPSIGPTLRSLDDQYKSHGVSRTLLMVGEGSGIAGGALGGQWSYVRCQFGDSRLQMCTNTPANAHRCGDYLGPLAQVTACGCVQLHWTLDPSRKIWTMEVSTTP